MPALITLTTDFEEQDHFAAALKGVLYSLCPGAQLADLSHTIPRSSVRAGAVFVAGAIPHFPKGTVHLVDVAPGPEPMAAAIGGQFIVCPNNGITTLLAERFPIEGARRITSPDILGSGGGPRRFFGREVFAPAAAALALGKPLESLGEPVEKVATLDLARPKREGKDTVVGRVIHIDRFGNLVTSIHKSFIEGCRIKSATVGEFPVGAIAESYAQVPQGSSAALFGSAGYLEIVYYGDRADKKLNMGIGVLVRAVIES